MTDTSIKEKAHGYDPVSFQTDTTNDLNFPTGQREGKAFATLAARFALAGHTLHAATRQTARCCITRAAGACPVPCMTWTRRRNS